MNGYRRILAALLAILTLFSLTAAAESRGDILAVVDGEEIAIDDAQAEFEYWAEMYEAYDMGDSIGELREEVAKSYVEKWLILREAAALGVELTEEEKQTLSEAAEADFEELLASYLPDFTSDDVTDEEARAATIAFFEENGLTLDGLIADYTEQDILSRCYDAIVKDAALSEEDVQAEYEARVAEQKEAYDADVSAYEINSMYYGGTVYYVPSGFRSIYHILFLLSDEDQAALAELEARLGELTAAEDADEDGQAAVEAEIDALFAPLYEKTDAVYARLDAGEDFMDVMNELSEDPGMYDESYIESGYHVHRDSVVWETNFRDAAMAIEEVGGLSEPVRTAYGLHILLYAGDIEGGPAALDEVREDIESELLETVRDAAYQEWADGAFAKADVEMFSDNLIYEPAAAEEAAD